jgi:hypothetical protein
VGHMGERDWIQLYTLYAAYSNVLEILNVCVCV